MNLLNKHTLTAAALLLSIGLTAAAQVLDPLRWTAAAEDAGDGTWEIVATGTFESADWHIYDLTVAEDVNSTAITVTGPGVEPLGEARILSPVDHEYSAEFGRELGVCKGTVRIAQRVRAARGTRAEVTLEWQCCNDRTKTCLAPGEWSGKVLLGGSAVAGTGASEAAGGKSSASEADASAGGRRASSAAGTQTAGGGICTADAPAGGAATASVSRAKAGNREEASSAGASLSLGDREEASASGSDAAAGQRRSLWSLILEAIAWGFVALLTPCVFPMIPLTVSFFLKQDGARGKALATLFGLSIVALYTIPIAVLIVISLLTGGHAVTADIFNWIATHWLPNILFFVIFMLFAASFFGAFEIRLPSKLVNSSDSKSDKGGVIGTFFVALTLVLVSFSCTGPIVGSVLIKSTQGEFWEPIVTMLAFSVAFALPFTLFAFVPSLLKKLPKSGGWLGSVKIVLGFIEIALGLKFLSVADQTYHWGILPRELYLAIWIVVFALLGFYLLGKIRFAGETPVEHIGVGRLFLSIITFTFVVWMIPGMWGAPLKALSGYLPPITSQEFNVMQQNWQPESDGGSGTAYAPGGKDAAAPAGRNVCNSANAAAPAGGGEASGGVAAHKAPRKYSDILQLPYGIPAHFDYNEARAAALKEGKPLFVDFTGHGCVNCREMESRVWSDPRVLGMLRNDYVVCALYADDKKQALPEDWVTTESGKTLKTIGKINSHFALTRFGVNAQPYYAILDPVTERPKVPSRGYDLNVEDYVRFLQEGLK